MTSSTVSGSLEIYYPSPQLQMISMNSFATHDLESPEPTSGPTVEVLGLSPPSLEALPPQGHVVIKQGYQVGSTFRVREEHQIQHQHHMRKKMTIVKGRKEGEERRGEGRGKERREEKRREERGKEQVMAKIGETSTLMHPWFVRWYSHFGKQYSSS